MTSHRSTLPLVLLSMLACTPATSGLGSESGVDESAGSETAADTDGGEGQDAEGSGDGDGDGDGAPGDGDADPTDTDPGDGDGDGDSGDGDGDGDGAPAVCGDGVIDEGEECDGDNLDGRDCTSLDFTGGELSCDGSCSFDTSACVNEFCGNGMIDPGEECDGQDIGSADCIMLGEGPGTPSCSDQCSLDLSTCGLPGEGQICAFDGDCPDGLYCEAFACYDGSLDDPCGSNDDCLSGNCEGNGWAQDTCGN